MTLMIRRQTAFSKELPNDFPPLPKLKWIGNSEPAFVHFLLVKLREYLGQVKSKEPEFPFVKKLLLSFLSHHHPHGTHGSVIGVSRIAPPTPTTTLPTN